jgi:hypothetical protein
METSGNRLLQSDKWRPHGHNVGPSTEDQTDVQLRRVNVGATIVGGAAMAAIRLLRSGALGGLPDPHSHRGGWRVVGVRSGGEPGRKTSMPKDWFGFLLHATNMALAAAGPADRAARQPYLPVLASLAAGAQAVVSARYLLQTMREGDSRWCPYCVTDAVTHFTTVALTLPEAAHAARRMLRSKRG